MNKKITKTELITLLGLTSNQFDCLVRDGVVSAQEKGQYDSAVVFNEIYSNFKKINKQKTAEVTNHKRKIKNLEIQIDKLKGKAAGGPVDDDGEPIIAKPRTMKEKMEIELGKRKINKMDMDEYIRRKKMIPIELLGEIVAKMAVIISGGLNPLPMLIKRSLPELPAHRYDAIVRDISNIRNQVADFEYDDNETVVQVLKRYEPKGFTDYGDDDE